MTEKIEKTYTDVKLFEYTVEITVNKEIEL